MKTDMKCPEKSLRSHVTISLKATEVGLKVSTTTLVTVPEEEAGPGRRSVGVFVETLFGPGSDEG